MVQTTVLKVDIACERCKRKLLKSISRLKGIDKIEADVAKGTLTVTGNTDPYKVIVQARKAARRCIEVVSVVSPPNPIQPKPNPGGRADTNKGKTKSNPDGGADTNEGKPKPDDNPKDYVPSHSCRSCERMYVISDYPDMSCSIL